MTVIQFFTGKDIQNSHREPLCSKSFQQLIDEIKRNQQLKLETDRIRKAAEIDKAAYERLKTRLPYFCCAEFRENIRRGENFIRIQTFILDLDKLKDTDTIQQLKNTLKKDNRIALMYVSPGGKGLKVVMVLSEEFRSQKDYSDFYKIFAWNFAEQYAITAHVDMKTHDASRVSFLCHDPEIYFNPDYEPIQAAGFLPARLTLEVIEKEPEIKMEKLRSENRVPEETYREIYKQLNPERILPRREKVIFVPGILDSIEEPIRSEANSLGIQVRDIRDIHYGKKYTMVLGPSFAEINVFHGSKGFSVVKTTKTGSDSRLAELSEILIRKALAGLNTYRLESENIPF